MSEIRLPRRRRSAARAPVIIDPAEIPDDAAGRVEVIVVRAPADVVDPGDVAAEPLPPLPETPGRLEAALLAGDGWVVTAVLAVVIVAIFLLGMALTR